MNFHKTEINVSAAQQIEISLTISVSAKINITKVLTKHASNAIILAKIARILQHVLTVLKIEVKVAHFVYAKTDFMKLRI